MKQKLVRYILVRGRDIVTTNVVGTNQEVELFFTSKEDAKEFKEAACFDYYKVKEVVVTIK